MNRQPGVVAPARVRRLAASAWKLRWQVELDAEARFARLADELEEIGASRPIVDLARRASRDEKRHAGLCAGLAEEYGESLPPLPAAADSRIAPPGLLPRGRVLYEVVASCCITETESVGVLTTLLGAVRGARLRAVLRELAEDEVAHSRLGWAHLASEHAQGVTSFLGPLIPAMIEGSVAPGVFARDPQDEGARETPFESGEEEELLEHGVLPRRLKLEVLTRTLEDVVFPGLDGLGVDTAAARWWLAEKLRAVP